MIPQPCQTLDGVLDEHGDCNLKMAYMSRPLRFPNGILNQIQLLFTEHPFKS